MLLSFHRRWCWWVSGWPSQPVSKQLGCQLSLRQPELPVHKHCSYCTTTPANCNTRWFWPHNTAMVSEKNKACLKISEISLSKTNKNSKKGAFNSFSPSLPISLSHTHTHTHSSTHTWLETRPHMLPGPSGAWATGWLGDESASTPLAKPWHQELLPWRKKPLLTSCCPGEDSTLP